jgi:hypothetical protein
MPNFITKDGVDLYRSNEGYVDWELYSQKFINSVQKFDFDDFISIPTFRDQDSDSWEGRKSAFERYLVELNISWFVYIKLYYNQGQLKPIVVGKTGSLLVNSKGTDLNFSMSTEDGPARRFLQENSLSWCKTQILVKECDGENNSYNLEKLYLDNGLFGS